MLPESTGPLAPFISKKAKKHQKDTPPTWTNFTPGRSTSIGRNKEGKTMHDLVAVTTPLQQVFDFLWVYGKSHQLQPRRSSPTIRYKIARKTMIWGTQWSGGCFRSNPSTWPTPPGPDLSRQRVREPPQRPERACASWARSRLMRALHAATCFLLGTACPFRVCAFVT